MLGNLLRNYRQFVAEVLGKLEFDFPCFSRFAKAVSLTNKVYGAGSGGFTEYEWFGENLSICRYARSKSVCLDYFVILVYDVLGESSNFETPFVIVRSVYPLQSLCCYSKVSVIYS